MDKNEKSWFSKLYNYISSDNPNTEEEKWADQRFYMIFEQIEKRGVRNEKVLEAMAKVPRHLFVPKDLISQSYMDCPLPIGENQTISQPYMVAYMTEILNLKGHEKILEIGTGSGYQTAILAEIVKEVYSIEIIKELHQKAQNIFSLIGYKNIHAKYDDGYKGWQEHSPFDGIIITAAPHKIPEKLFDQLKINGTMVVPIGKSFCQELKLIKKTEKGITEKFLMDVRFVPMTGSILTNNI